MEMHHTLALNYFQKQKSFQNIETYFIRPNSMGFSTDNIYDSARMQFFRQYFFFISGKQITVYRKSFMKEKKKLSFSILCKINCHVLHLKSSDKFHSICKRRKIKWGNIILTLKLFFDFFFKPYFVIHFVFV